MALNINGALPVAINTVEQHSGSFKKYPKLLLVAFLAFALLGLYVFRRLGSPVQPNNLNQQQSLSSSAASRKEDVPFDVEGETFANNQAYMEHEFENSRAFGSVARMVSRTGGVIHFVKCPNVETGDGVDRSGWCVIFQNGVTGELSATKFPNNPSFRFQPMQIDDLDEICVGPKLTAEEVFAFIDAKSLATN